MGIEAGTEVAWEGAAGAVYQVQWSPAGGGGAWKDLGEAVEGDGGRMAVVDGVGGGRVYRVMESVAGGDGGVNLLGNGGFERGLEGWEAVAGHGVVEGGGSDGGAALACVIDEAKRGLRLAGVAEGVVAGEEYGLEFRARQVVAGPAYVQQYRLEWVDGGGGMVEAGGWVDFAGGDGEWAVIGPVRVVAPAGAVGVRVAVYCASGAVEGSRGEVWLDDFVLAGAGGVEEREVVAEERGVVRLAWASVAGVAYEVEANDSLDAGGWTVVGGPLEGTGGVLEYVAPMEGGGRFFRVRRPVLTADAPGNVRVVESGVAGTITVAWDAVEAPGVVGYRVVYESGGVERSVEVGLVGSVTLEGLVPGGEWVVGVVALTADGPGEAGEPVVARVEEGGVYYEPLYGPWTVLEPDAVVETETALVTRLADRARDRHAREGLGFLVSDGPEKAAAYRYDHYLPFYWEQRVAQLEIVDEVAKGGGRVEFRFTTQARLNPAEFRTFFNVGSPLSGYHNNQSDLPNAGVELVSTGPSVWAPGETDYNYRAVVSAKMPENRALRVGDRIEVELSQFLLNPRNGRNNYYGTALLYVVGVGVVPWYAKEWEEAAEKVVGVTSFDSYPLPEEAWLGGWTTLPYQYSNEPEHRFKQMAGNITPGSGRDFLLGRRLHHTDFLTGGHSEPGNPVFTAHAGKAGAGYAATSCVACHVNNGRSLLPELGGALDGAVVRVAGSADGAPHGVLGERVQPFSTAGTGEGAVVLAGYEEIEGAYGDGTPYTLRKPVVGFGGVVPEHHSLRTAPPLVGLGLLEAVEEEDIVALADPGDADGDGISGRVRLVEDPEQPGVARVGRFTHKAGQARVLHQIAHALNRDMGVVSGIFPVLDGETSPRPTEIGGEELDLMNRYVSLLGVGAQRGLDDAVVARGRGLFASASCVACHTPEFTTGPYHPMAELRNQVIRPYTDLLLHDMGPGLADTMAEGGASAAEWRTAPLWNIGLGPGVGGGEGYLHDGRARTLEEAILWHGGEAEAAKEAFRTMPAEDRAAVVEFLRSL